MTTQFCISNQSESEIFALAKGSEEFIREHQISLLIAPGTEFQLHQKPGDGFAETYTPFIELKLAQTGFTLAKILMKEGYVISLNQSNFNKHDFPVRNFKDKLLLERVKGETELVRTYSLEGLESIHRHQMRVGSTGTLASHAASRFLEALVGKDNISSDIHPQHKAVIQYRAMKINKGSFYNSIVFKFNAIGDCTPLKVGDVDNLLHDDIYIRYSFSKNKFFIYHGDKPNQVVKDMLIELELSGQKSFYIKPDFRVNPDHEAYIEPVLPISRTQ